MTTTEDLVARLEAAMTQIQQAQSRAQQAEARCTLANAVRVSLSLSLSRCVARCWTRLSMAEREPQLIDWLYDGLIERVD